MSKCEIIEQACYNIILTIKKNNCIERNEIIIIVIKKSKANRVFTKKKKKI